MIISVTCGGLGNMMFQIAAGYAHSKKVDSDFGYSVDRWHSVTSRDIHKYTETTFKNIKQVPIINQPSFQEQGMLYQKLPETKNLNLVGYFQSEKYFMEYSDEIQNLFDVPVIPEYKDYTFLHIRRGDYLKYADYHGVLSKEYYEHALDIINPNKVIVITDDPEWASTHELFQKFEISKELNDLVDFSIMKSCKNAIIANSSFSWWGAWLGNCEQVVAPQKWFSASVENEIVPSHWKTI